DVAVRPPDPEFGFIGRYALGELRDGLSQLVGIVWMKQSLNACRCRNEGSWVDSKDAVLALVPHPVAIDPVPIPGAHFACRDGQAAALLTSRSLAFDCSSSAVRARTRFSSSALNRSSCRVLR